MNSAQCFYAKWLTSSPLERFHIQADALVNRYRDGRYSRVDQRAVSLLLAAVGSEIKEDIISLRLLGSSSIVFKVMTKYQPGGAAEKQQLLSFLTHPDAITSNQGAVKALRKWRRWFARASELHLVVPDPTLQLKGLERLAPALTATAEFRLQSFRTEALLDQAPAQSKVLQFSELLLSEAEEAVLGERAVKKPTLAKADASDGDQGQKGKPKAKAACKRWMTAGGCRYPGSCSFAHSPFGKGDKRCFACSSTEHFKDSCPYRHKGPDSGGPKAKGSGTRKGAERQGKGDQSTPSGTQTAAKAEDSAKQDMFREVTAAIKQLTQQSQPTVKALDLCPTLDGIPYPRIQTGRATGLLDSGAATCVRPKVAGEIINEWRTVALAEGEAKMGVTPLGTLLGAPGSEPIVSMSKLVKLGFHVAWRGKACTVVHPTLGRVPVTVIDGWSRVDRLVALDLIQRIEAWEQDKLQRSGRETEMLAKVTGVMQGRNEQEYIQGLCEAAVDGDHRLVSVWADAVVRKLYPEAPDRVCREVSTQVPFSTEALYWNRRRRRSFERANAVVVHLCCGESRGFFAPVACQRGYVVIDVDVQENLNSPHTMMYLLSLAARGMVKAVLSGLPCRTRSQLRNRPPGPPVIRGRDGEPRWGLPSATVADRIKLFEDDCLLLRTLLLMRVASEGLRLKYGDCPPLHGLLKNPRDPRKLYFLQ